jgi:hypothetical protein
LNNKWLHANKEIAQRKIITIWTNNTELDNLGKTSNGKYRHVLYTTKLKLENQMEKAVQDSKEEG